MSSVNPPIFIVGMPRSGTTLLSNLLNATKEIYFPEETHFYQVVEKFYHNQKSDIYLDYLNPKKNQYLKSLKLTDNEIFNLRDFVTKNEQNINNRKFLEKLFEIKLTEKKIKRWGEKTPIHFTYISTILTDFEHGKIVNVIRDPRDVIQSIRLAKWNKFFDIKKRLDQYKLNIAISNRKIDSVKILNIKFEDLVLYPKKTLKEVCQFCEIDFDEEIINNFFLSENLNFKLENEPWKINNSKPLDPKNVFKWKSNSNSFENKFVSWYCEQEIISLNYERNIFPSFFMRKIYFIWINIVSKILKFL